MRRRRPAIEGQEKGEDRQPMVKKLRAVLLGSFRGSTAKKRLYEEGARGN